MHDVLIKYINGFGSIQLTAHDIEMVKVAFKPKKLRKKQFFLQEGEVCKYSGFIVRGAMRQYQIDDDGIEHVINLGIENWWITDRDSYVNLTPSKYYIDAWEETELLVITKADFAKYLEGIPAIMQMIRVLDERYSVAVQKRINASISLTAEKRYMEFANSYPEFLQRFPQHIIASYLGITKETLSRVRKQMLKG